MLSRRARLSAAAGLSRFTEYVMLVFGYVDFISREGPVI